MKMQMSSGNGAGQPSSPATAVTSPTLRRKGWIRALSLTLFTAWLGQTHAQTIVCGNVSGTWTKANSPYVVTCDLIVPAGQTLTIQPGVAVKFAQGLKMTVNGNLVADGTAAERITISGTSPSVYWDTICINYTGGAQSSLRNCSLSAATNALYISVDQVTATNAAQVLNCTFSNCVNLCIYGGATGREEMFVDRYPTLNTVIAGCLFLNSSNAVQISVSGANSGWGGGLGSVSPLLENNVFKGIAGNAVSFTVTGLIRSSSPKLVNSVFLQCGTAVQKTGSDPSFSEAISYNCLYNNQTNFVGYAPGTYGAICCVNARGTNCDLANNILENPLFCETTNYTLSASSPCIDAGNPAAAYLDCCFATNFCQPGSLGTTVNDIGVWGGPYACPPGTGFLIAAQQFVGVVIYPSTPGRYRLEYRPNVNTGIWTQLTNVVLQSTPFTYIDFDYPGVGKRFYQAVLLP